MDKKSIHPKKSLSNIFKPKDEYRHREYYYENLFNKYKDATSYQSIITKVKSKHNIVSQRMISFDDNPFEKVTKQNIVKLYGKPSYQNKTDSVLNTELFFYRLIIGGHKVKLDMHFHNNHLFFYSYTFSYLKEDEKLLIINLIEKKYLNGQHFDYKNFNITDNRHSVIHIIDAFDFTIDYISSITSDLFKNIDAIITKQTLAAEKKQKKTSEELYNKL